MSYFFLCNNSSALEQSTFDTFYNSIICVTDGSFSLGWILDSSSSLLSVGGLPDSAQHSINLTHRPSRWPSTTVRQFFLFYMDFPSGCSGCSCDYIRIPSSKREQAPVHAFQLLPASCLRSHWHKEHIKLGMIVIMSYGRA